MRGAFFLMFFIHYWSKNEYSDCLFYLHWQEVTACPLTSFYSHLKGDYIYTICDHLKLGFLKTEINCAAEVTVTLNQSVVLRVPQGHDCHLCLCCCSLHWDQDDVELLSSTSSSAEGLMLNHRSVVVQLLEKPKKPPFSWPLGGPAAPGAPVDPEGRDIRDDPKQKRHWSHQTGWADLQNHLDVGFNLRRVFGELLCKPANT